MISLFEMEGPVEERPEEVLANTIPDALCWLASVTAARREELTQVAARECSGPVQEAVAKAMVAAEGDVSPWEEMSRAEWDAVQSCLLELER